MGLHCFQDVLLGLCAEAGQRADAPVLRGPVQLFDRLHVEIVVQRLDPLRPQPGNFQQLGDRGRQFAAQTIQQAAMPGGDDLVDPGGEIGADAGQPGQVFPALNQYPRLLRQVAQDARGIAIGADAERIRAFDFQQVGNRFESGGNVGVMYGHIRIVFR